MMTDPGFHFDIDPSIVFQLGESLISDEVQALVELVKNAYDSDADYAKITIDTKNVVEDDRSRYRGSRGYIVVEDNGLGMTSETIKAGWLMLSAKLKREAKRQKQTTSRGRTPLGDKGVGRLGAQRLGYNVEVFSSPIDGDEGCHVAFSWKDFSQADSLYKVPVHYQAWSPSEGRSGTTLLISDLRDTNRWAGDALSDLERELSKLISPYEVRDFMVLVTVDGKRLELAEITARIRDTAHVRYRIDFDGQLFRVHGKARLAFFRPEQPQKDIDDFRELAEADDGASFLRFLLSQPKAREIGLAKAKDNGWFITYELQRCFGDFDSLAQIRGQLANPGPFHAEVDTFNLGKLQSREQSVFDRAAEYKRYIKEHSGVRVYRDGFGIRVDRDWLKLGAQQTSGGSYYGLRPQNTLGFVALSARDNALLEEKTDREGFKVTPHYQNFFEMLQQFVRFAETTHDFVRRGWKRFRLQNRVSGAKMERVPRAPELSRKIAKELDWLKRREDPAKSEDMSTNSAFMGPEVSRSAEIVQILDKISKEAEVLVHQVDGLDEQIEDVYNIIGLGLLAEVLSHEIHNIADHLAMRNDQLVQHLKKAKLRDWKISAFTEYVQTSIAGLRRQLAHLAPTLKYVRHKRDNISMATFDQEIETFFSGRLAKNGIRLVADVHQDFQIAMNKGKLVQIFDNIMLNSEYWLKEDQRLGHVEKGVINIEIAKPYLRISDNGRGVDPSVEASLFDPYVTTKGRGKGRGLGLFIVRQLLDSEGCSISLLPQRNSYGRRNVFEMDFRGAMIHHEQS